MAESTKKGRTAEQKLAGYKYVGCRLRRHQWDEEGIFSFQEGSRKYVVLRFQCISCELGREDFYNLKGEFQFRNYIYPDGYIIRYDDGDERITTRVVARVAIKRAASDKSIRPYEERE